MVYGIIKRARGCLIALVGQHSVLTLNYIILAKTRKICGVLYIDTSYNPQNLRNIIKKVAKISIVQVIYYRTCLSKQPYFATYFDICHKFYRFRLVVDINIIT